MKINFFPALISISIIYFLFTKNSCIAQYTKLFDFNSPIAANPYGELLSDGANLYGMTCFGGANDSGTIFKIKPDGSGYTVLYNLSGVMGGNPFGSLISDGTFLYGMTKNGGEFNNGVIFKILPDGTGFDTLFNFSGINGSQPRGTLISQGNFFYGTTYTGGVNNYGTIFKIRSDGTGFSKLFDFSNTDGANPHCLISDGVFLYGVTNAGGIGGTCPDGCGVIFKIKTDGTSYTQLHNFSGAADGGKPQFSSLHSDGIYLYGLTRDGGTQNGGIIYKIKNDGTNFTTLYNFNTDGIFPTGSLISDGNFLYGLTSGDNSGLCPGSGCGVIFKIKPDGSSFLTLYNFTGFADSATPYGSLISSGTILFGMTSEGGTNNKGTIFKFGITSDIYEYNTLSIDKIFPNPSNSQINIELKENIEELNIINVLGDSILKENIVSKITTIDVSDIRNGIYIVRIKTSKSIYSKLIIIQH